MAYRGWTLTQWLGNSIAYVGMAVVMYGLFVVTR
jgi:hypothetical protein